MNELAVQNSQLVTTPTGGTIQVKLKAQDLIERAHVIEDVFKKVMREGVHYGQIDGTKEVSLWKPGAEKLGMVFGLVTETLKEDLSVPGEIRYRVTTKVYSQDGAYLCAGLGECSSNEEKFKWRAIVSEAEWEATPQDSRRTKYKRDDTQIKQVRTEPSDQANAVLKRADKRSYVAAIIKATGTSDMFCQDLEDVIGDDGILSTDDQPVFYIKDVTAKTAKYGQKYTIKTVDGKTFSTFKKEHGDLATKLKLSKKPCTIEFKTGQYGNDLTKITEITLPEKPALESDTRTKLLEAFINKLGVTQAMLEEHQGKVWADFSDEDIAELTGIGIRLEANPTAILNHFPKANPPQK